MRPCGNPDHAMEVGVAATLNRGMPSVLQPGYGNRAASPKRRYGVDATDPVVGKGLFANVPRSRNPGVPARAAAAEGFSLPWRRFRANRT